MKNAGKIGIGICFLTLTIMYPLDALQEAGRGRKNLVQETAGDCLLISNKTYKFGISINKRNGIYKVVFQNETWLGTGLVLMHRNENWYLSHTPPDKPTEHMKLTKCEQSEGKDQLGNYSAIVLSWQLTAPQVLRFQTGFKIYADIPYLIFEHQFLDEFKEIQSGVFRRTTCNFPAFAPGDGSGNALCKDNVNLFSYEYRVWPAPWFGEGLSDTLERWRNKGDQVEEKGICTPLIVFDESHNTIVLSPFNDFMARLVRIAPLDEWGWGEGIAVGISGEVKSIPQGHISRTILTFGQGVTDTMLKWGDGLLKWSGKQRPGLYQTPILKYLGYWTDNGAYYYYRTAPGMNYQETLLTVKEYHKNESIPIGYYQLDSWWYPKGETEKSKDGVIEWVPWKSVFPDGIKYLQGKLGAPLALHNRWFHQDTVYIQKYPFWIEDKGVHPKTKQFWLDLAKQAAGWGCEMYEQDWLDTQFFKVHALRNNLTAAQQWLSDMAEACAENALEIQYCMPTVGCYLESTQYPAVTNIRVSNDYKVREMGLSKWLWHQFGYCSLLAWAVGLYPSKDVFITSPEHSYQFAEPYNIQEALLSILGAGLVGIGDAIGFTDKELISKLCLEDGRLVKPDRPALPIEKCFFYDPYAEPEPLILHTCSTINGKKWYYVAVFNVCRMNVPVELELKPEEIGIQGKCVCWDYFGKKLTVAEPTTAIERTLEPREVVYYIFAPLLAEGTAVLGDLSKFVSCSTIRINHVELEDNLLRLMVSGIPNTRATFCVYVDSCPQRVMVADQEIPYHTEVSKLKQVEEGWRWDSESNLLSLKINLQPRIEVQVLK